jgi:AraC-like DNA-binding protein
MPIAPIFIARRSELYAPLLLRRRSGEEIEVCDDYAQAFLVLSGALVISAGDDRWIVPKGYTAWIPARYRHREQYYGDVELVGLFLKRPQCGSLMDAPAVLRTGSTLAVLVRRLATEPMKVDSQARQERMLAVLFDELALAKWQALVLPSPQDPRLLGITRALLDCPGDLRTIDELAHDFALSHRTLARLFREETAISFEMWRIRRRIIAAIELLAEGKSVTQVSSDLGYDSLSSFIRTFRRLMGVSPGAWVKKQCDLKSRYGGIDGLLRHSHPLH